MIKGVSAAPRDREEQDSDGESEFSIRSKLSQHTAAFLQSTVRGKIQGGLQSGFLDKPRSNIVRKLHWPHMNQDPRYVTEPLSFNQLNFAQFVGGECRTIMKTRDPIEWQGRLRVLSKIAYLHDICRNWERARATYFAIMGSIEEGEMDWNNSFGHYDLMCPAPPPVVEQKGERNQYSNPRVRVVNRRDFFCKEFQKGECMQQAPHKAWIRNNNETVDHFCVNCFRAKMGKLDHTPGSIETCVKK